MFPNMEDLLNEFTRPRPPLTRWQKVVKFVKNDLLFIGIISFFGSMSVIGITVTGLFFIRWLFSA